MLDFWVRKGRNRLVGLAKWSTIVAFHVQKFAKKRFNQDESARQNLKKKNTRTTRESAKFCFSSLRFFLFFFFEKNKLRVKKSQHICATKWGLEKLNELFWKPTSTSFLFTCGFHLKEKKQKSFQNAYLLPSPQINRLEPFLKTKHDLTLLQYNGTPS